MQGRKQQSYEELKKKNNALKRLLREEQDRLQEVEETLEAIRSGAVDGLVRRTPEGNQIFTLKGAEQPYRNLIEEMTEGALLISKSGIILYCNNGFAKLVDVRLDRIMGTDVREWVSTSSVETLSKIVSNNYTDDKEVFDVTFQTRRKKPVPTLVSIHSVKMGSLDVLALIVTDLSTHMEEEVKRYTTKLESEISERIKAQEALQISEANYKHLLEYAPTAIYEIDYVGPRFKNVNDAMCQLTGYTKEELLQKNPMDLLTPESQERFVIRTKKILAGEKIDETVEFTAKTKNGKEIQIILYVKPTYKEGKLDGALVVGYDITERKKAEKALKESEERFRVLTQTSPIGVGVSSADGVFLYTNPAYESILGYNLNELVGKKAADVYFNPADRTSWLQRMEEGLDVRNFEIMLKRKDGTPVWVAINTSDISYGGKQAVMGTIQDITERKRMQEKLEEYAKNLESLVAERTKKLETSALYARGLIEANLDPLVTINAEGKITDVNKATETATGCSREELVGSDFSNYFTQPDEARRGLMQVFQKGYVKDYPLSIRSKSGEVVEVLYNATLFKNEAGEVEGVFAAARDMTEHKKAEKAILNERKRLFDVLETLPVMVCILTQEHHVDFANRSFRNRFGNSEGRYCYDYCYGNKAPCSFCESYTPLETGKPHNWEVNAPDGSIIDAYDFPFTDVDGSRKILEMDIDITEQKRMEKQLKDSERLAAVGATAGMVGHDIRNPLQAIAGDVYLLRSELASMPESEAKESMKESLNGIDENVQYVNKIVQDLQDYNRQFIPAPKEISLKSFCEDLLFENEIPQNIKASCQVDEKGQTVVTDPELLKRVLSNLLTNALQAMPKGGKLELHAYQETGDTVIAIKDSGEGIPEEIKPKLFTPLFTTKARGQGFGLAVAKRLSETLGGTIMFESEMGKGTTFYVRLPNKKRS